MAGRPLELLIFLCSSEQRCLMLQIFGNVAALKQVAKYFESTTRDYYAALDILVNVFLCLLARSLGPGSLLRALHGGN